MNSKIVKNKKRLIIFDLDGTLYQTHITTVQAVNKALEVLNLPPVSQEHIISVIGETIDVFCKKLLPDINAEERTGLADNISLFERELIPQCGKLYENVEEMLATLSGMGYTLAICSNGRKEYVDTVLTCCGIAKYFTYVQSRFLQKTKDELIKDLLSEFNPDFATLVGDRIQDINAAKANKIPCIGAKYGYGKEECDFADFTVRNANEITGVIMRCAVFEAIQKHAFKHKANSPLIIGINGVDASGKTLFTAGLVSFLQSKGYKTATIHMDDFHNQKKTRVCGDDVIQSYIRNAFNLQLLEEGLLKPLKNGLCINKELQLLDLGSDTYTNKKRYIINEETVVIVEGTLLYRKPVSQYIDYKVYLDVPFHEVLKRAKIRDVPVYGPEIIDRYINKYIPIQKWYIKTCQPMQFSNMVIDNTNFDYPKILKGV